MNMTYSPGWGNQDPYIIVYLDKNKAVWYRGLSELVDLDTEEQSGGEEASV